PTLSDVYSPFEELSHNFAEGFYFKNVFEIIDNDPYENIFDGLKAVKFLNNNRVVKEARFNRWENKFTNQSGQMWEYSSSDWWDNCLNPEWTNFKIS
ncbi:MAG: hypothetical protein GY827_01555, partial [Cytophagales bacterium]|nr:hypothetical protein [Cytophagales bacterium]